MVRGGEEASATTHALVWMWMRAADEDRALSATHANASVEATVRTAFHAFHAFHALS